MKATEEIGCMCSSDRCSYYIGLRRMQGTPGMLNEVRVTGNRRGRKQGAVLESGAQRVSSHADSPFGDTNEWEEVCG